MTEKIEGIVLGVIRHSDRHNVVTMFTRERGRMSFLSHTGSGKSARMINARLQPLGLIEADVNIHPAKELVTLGRFSTPRVWKSLYFHPVKQALTLFLQEFLDKLLRSSAPDPALYDYLLRAIDIIDRSPEGHCANLHIALITGLLEPMGIYPNLEDWQPGDWFDMRGGEFTAERPLHNDILLPSDASFLPLLARMTMRNARCFRFNAEERNRLLTLIVRYWAIHFPGLGRLNSIDILREVYRG